MGGPAPLTASPAVPAPSGAGWDAVGRMEPEPTPSTADPAYTARLRDLEGRGWKQRLDVQAPYRWNLRRLHPGLTLDVGCEIGRAHV